MLAAAEESAEPEVPEMLFRLSADDLSEVVLKICCGLSSKFSFKKKIIYKNKLLKFLL